MGRMKTYAAIFLSVFLAELGDKTQFATILFASEPGLTRWGVVAAAGGALLVSTVLAVLVGTWIGTWLPPRHLRLAAAVGFIAIGVWILVRG
jgi:putative Ca2+/H+ antiporter (TMEM165/GDT1 family)